MLTTCKWVHPSYNSYIVVNRFVFNSFIAFFSNILSSMTKHSFILAFSETLRVSGFWLYKKIHRSKQLAQARQKPHFRGAKTVEKTSFGNPYITCQNTDGQKRGDETQRKSSFVRGFWPHVFQRFGRNSGHQQG